MKEKTSGEKGITRRGSRPRLHFTPQTGWVNDPNGLVWFQGQYHLFYQYNPYHSNWDSMHWGHAVSRDLLHWEELEPALFPDMPYDNHPEGGCFSGSAVVWKDKLYLFYTGRIKQDGRVIETQCLAVSEDGRAFHKVKENPLIDRVPEGGGADFRDPKVFFAQGKWRMICGGTDGLADCADSTGRIYLYSSENLYQWEYEGILYEAKAKEGSMFECPDMFPLEDSWVITASPMNAADFRPNTYMVGKADFEHCSFQVQRKGILDGGTHFYAVQSYPDCTGKILSIAWLGGWLWMPWMQNFGPEEGYRGILSIPRELYLDEEGWLCSKPFAGMEEISDITKKEECLEAARPVKMEIPPQGQALYLKLSVDFGDKGGRILELLFSDEAKNRIVARMDPRTGRFTVDYSDADVYSRFGCRSMEWELTAEKCDMEIILDGNIFTVFFNHGRYSYTGKIYPEGGISLRASFCPEEGKRYDITAFGEILIDFTEQGRSREGQRLFAQNPGGAPANVAVAARRLGADTAFLGKVGEDSPGRFLVETLYKEGVETKGIIRDQKYFTTLAFVQLTTDGERAFSFARKPGADTQMRKEELNMEIVEHTRIFHVGSLSLTDEPARETTFYAVKRARERGAIISYDPNYRASLWEGEAAAEKHMKSMIPYADIMKLSDEETELLTGQKEIEAAAEVLLEQGVRIVLITLGAKGAYVCCDKGAVFVPGFVSRVVDTNGAGDSFMGGFLYKMNLSGKGLSELSLEELRDFACFGNAVAGVCVEKKGAIPAMPGLKEVEAKLKTRNV